MRKLGEVLVAFVVLDRGETMTPDEFFEYCKTEMVKYKRPVEVQLRRRAAEDRDEQDQSDCAAVFGVAIGPDERVRRGCVGEIG